MSLARLQRKEVATALGVIPVWAPPGDLESERPVLLTITGAWADGETMTRLPEVVGPGWTAVLMRLPGNDTPPLAETSIAAWAGAVDELIATAFAGRQVVVMGISIGALVALALRSPQVRRIVALEPPLETGKLWPMTEQLRARRAAAPQDAAFIAEVFGVSDAAAEGRSYRHLVAAARVPIDVVAGEVPLMPPRVLERYPSFLDEADRAWLQAQPRVRLHVAPGAGHNIHVFADLFLRDVLLDALARALDNLEP